MSMIDLHSGKPWKVMIAAEAVMIDHMKDRASVPADDCGFASVWRRQISDDPILAARYM